MTSAVIGMQTSSLDCRTPWIIWPRFRNTHVIFSQSLDMIAPPQVGKCGGDRGFAMFFLLQPYLYESSRTRQASAFYEHFSLPACPSESRVCPCGYWYVAAGIAERKLDPGSQLLAVYTPQRHRIYMQAPCYRNIETMQIS